MYFEVTLKESGEKLTAKELYITSADIMVLDDMEHQIPCDQVERIELRHSASEVFRSR